MSSPEKMLLPLRRELAAEALEGAAFQCTAAARFLWRGDDVAAIEAYSRIRALFNEFVAPEMKIIAEFKPDELTAKVAAEWRDDRDKSAPKTRRAAA